MSDEKIIRFPTGGRGGSKGAPGKPTTGDTAEPPLSAGPAVDPAALSADQRKALGIVLSGMPFVLIGIKPTPSGADFFTAIGGDDADLRNARSHLDGVIDRAYERKGI